MSVARAPSPAEAVSNLAEELRAQLAGAGEPGLRPLELGGVLLGPGILDRVADVVAELPRGEGDVALVADRRPMATAGGEVKATVAACRRRPGVLHGHLGRRRRRRATHRTRHASEPACDGHRDGHGCRVPPSIRSTQVIEFVFMLTHNDVTVAAGSVATAAQIADLVGVSR